LAVGLILRAAAMIRPTKGTLIICVRELHRAFDEPLALLNVETSKPDAELAAGYIERAAELAEVAD
jgi:hypothetical protein